MNPHIHLTQLHADSLARRQHNDQSLVPHYFNAHHSVPSFVGRGIPHGILPPFFGLSPPHAVVSQTTYSYMPTQAYVPGPLSTTSPQRCYIAHVDAPHLAQSRTEKDIDGELGDLVAKYKAAWQACQAAALAIQTHESNHGENSSVPSVCDDRRNLQTLHIGAMQDVLVLSNQLIAKTSFKGTVEIAMPDSDADAHMKAMRISQQFLLTHIEATQSVLLAVEHDMSRLRARIEGGFSGSTANVF